MRIRRRLLHWKPVIHAMRRLGFVQSYAQNGEDLIVWEYFKGRSGALLSIGENDGRMFSNVLFFILRGWSADLVEPSPTAFLKLRDFHCETHEVYLHKLAIGTKNGYIPFYDSGNLIGVGDTALISSLNKQFTSSWGKPFSETSVLSITFDVFLKSEAFHKQYHLIAIDAETMDWAILQQMDLTALGCKCLIIEHGGDTDVFYKMREYCKGHGLKVLHITPENVIFGEL